jgi:UDP-N-acetylglucosamine--N-acetylmuramyl-(pentapeptide) pyrophosphoryl-undecaprenol N-acetylglucosamine transferase
VVVLCDRRGARYLEPGIRHHVIRALSPSGRITGRLRGITHQAAGFAQSLVHLRRLRPAAVATFGGYASVPVGLAAHALRLPVLAHEQNAVLGRANRLIARRAARLALTFEATRGAELVPATRRVVTGNPVRAAVAGHRDDTWRPPAADEPLCVLVVGGSQGARVFSDVLPAAIARLSDAARARLALTQQCRPEDLDRVASAYAEIGFSAELKHFFDDLPARLARTHLVISRSGASSVAELLVLGRPSLLVPYRFAADDHQRANAEVLAEAGAAWLIAETELSTENLARHLEQALAEPGQLCTMAARARALGGIDAAEALADEVAALTHHRTATQPGEALA